MSTDAGIGLCNKPRTELFSAWWLPFSDDNLQGLRFAILCADQRTSILAKLSRFRWREIDLRPQNRNFDVVLEEHSLRVTGVDPLRHCIDSRAVRNIDQGVRSVALRDLADRETSRLFFGCEDNVSDSEDAFVKNFQVQNFPVD